MYGSNDYGSAYYGQGPAEGTTFILHSVTATVVTTASIAFQILINMAVSATVTTTATVSRLVSRVLSDTVSVTASVTSTIVLGLNIRQAATKFLNMYRSTNPVAGFDNESEPLNQKTTTRRITEA